MPEQLAFGPFVVDLRRRKLIRHNKEVVVGDRVFRVLEELVLRPGQVVTKDELLQKVWPETDVYEWALTQAVHHFREALKDNPRHPVFVQTVPRIGYRFVAEVHEPENIKPKRNRSHLLALGLLGVTLVTLGVVTRLGRKENLVTGQVREVYRFQESLMKPAVSPDGTFVAAVGASPSSPRHSLYVYAGTEKILLSDDLDVRGPSPVFDHDGRRLLFCAVRREGHNVGLPDLWEVSVFGGKPRLVASLAWAGDFHPSGEGLVLAVAREQTTSVVIRDSQGRESLLVERGFWPRWSPDGKWVAYTTSNPEGGSGSIWVVSSDGRRRRKISREFSQVYGLAWSYHPQGVVCGARTGDDLPFQLYWLSLDGKTERQLTVGTGDYVAPSVTREDKIFFCLGKERAALFVAAGRQHPFGVDTQRAGLFDACFVEGTRHTVWLQRQNEIPELCFRPPGEETPTCRVLPGALRLLRANLNAALVARGNGMQVFVEEVELATGHVKRLAEIPFPASGLDASPTGSWLGWIRWSRAGEEVAFQAAGASVSFWPAPGAESISGSADGRWIAWARRARPEGREATGVWVLPTGGQWPRQIAKDGLLPVWADNRHLFFLRNDGGLTVWGADAETGTLRVIRAVDLVHFPLRFLVGSTEGPFGLLAVTNFPSIYTLEGWKQ